MRPAPLPITLVVLLSCVSCCFGEWGEQDQDILGTPLDAFQKSAKSCNLTSKGREIQVLDHEDYMEDLAVKRLKNFAYILKDDSEKTVLEVMRILELGENQLKGGTEMEKKQRDWLEKNCEDGPNLYLYERHAKYGTTVGYCLIKGGIITNSFILGEGGFEPGEKPPVNYDVPPSLAVSIHASAIQPADYPVVIALNLTGTDKGPFSYWCGGPGIYPNANIFTAQVTDAKGQTQSINLENGQYSMGSGRDHEIKPGEVMEVPASLGLLTAGIYHIQVGTGPEMKVEVKNDFTLSEKRSQEILSGIHHDDPFQQFIGIHYHLKAIVDALQNDITGSDVALAEKAAQAFYSLNPKPENLVITITQAMQRQLNSTSTDPMRFNLMMTLAQMAGELATDDALVPLLAVIATDTSKLPDRGLIMYDSNLEDAKLTAVKSLESFKQQRAVDELHHLLKDSHFWIRTAAAQILARRKDRAGIEILRDHVADMSSLNRSESYEALLSFSDDPEYESLINSGLEDKDSEIQRAAEEATEKLHKIQKFRKGEF